MNPKIDRMKKRLEAANSAFVKTVRTVQKCCKHKNIAECDYYSDSFLVLPPIRICLSCGMTEEGWGCGYIILKNATTTSISREGLYDLREGLMIRHGYKGPLVRREITIDQLIDGVEDI